MLVSEKCPSINLLAETKTWNHNCNAFTVSVNTPIPPFSVVLDESVLSTLHRGGEGQNVFGMIFSNYCDNGCLREELTCYRFFIWPIITIFGFCNNLKLDMIKGFKRDHVINWWRHNDANQFHGAALTRHTRYASLLKLITNFSNAILARTQWVRCSFFLFKNWMSRTKLHGFTDALNIAWWFLKGLRLKRTSVQSANHFHDNIQLSTQNYINFKDSRWLHMYGLQWSTTVTALPV